MNADSVEKEELNVRVETACQLIRTLYNVKIQQLCDSSSLRLFCEENRLHPIQFYFYHDNLERVWKRVAPSYSYHISDALMIHFILFYAGNLSFVFGPFCPEHFSERSAAAFVEKSNLAGLEASDVLSYQSMFPTISEYTAQMIVSSFISAVCPGGKMVTTCRITDLHGFPVEAETVDIPRKHHQVLIERRYAAEQQFAAAILEGDGKKALACLHKMRQDVDYIKSACEDLETERIAAAITRTTIRHAATRAGLPATIVDSVSSEHTRQVRDAGTKGEILQMTDDLVVRFCVLIREMSSKKYSALVQNCLYYLRNRYAERIDFSELVEQFNVSETYLIAQFKKEVGLTPNAYLNRTRLNAASHLLLNGDMYIADIISAVGINDSSYFIKMFKKQFGETPGAYRKRRMG